MRPAVEAGLALLGKVANPYMQPLLILSPANVSFDVAFPLRKATGAILVRLRLYRKCYMRNPTTAPQLSARSRALSKRKLDRGLLPLEWISPNLL
jgi:hypothetical protein